MRSNAPFFDLLTGIGKKMFCGFKKKLLVWIIRLSINIAHILLYQYQKETFPLKLYFCPKCQKCLFELAARNKKIFVSIILLEISKRDFNVMVRQLLCVSVCVRACACVADIAKSNMCCNVWCMWCNIWCMWFITLINVARYIFLGYFLIA